MSPGTVHAAAAAGMGVRDFRDLVCWRLCHALKCEVFEFTSRPPASRHFKYRDQIRDASASSPGNIAEGFGRFRPLEFARFLEFACGSIAETKNHLIDGRDRGYLADDLFSRLWNLACVAERATVSLLRTRREQGRRESSMSGKQERKARHR